MDKKKLSSIIVILSLAGCGGSNGGNGGLGGVAGESVVAQAGSTVTNDNAVDSARFLMDAYRDGLSEIALSQLALQKAANNDVKRFAQRMIGDHTRLNNDIGQLAQSKNIALPIDVSAEQTAQAERLAALSGDEFDRAYMAINVAVHEKAVTAARQQARQGNDADVRMLASTSLPLLETHLAAAKELDTLLDPAAFLALAYQDGLAEIQLSRLALQKATRDDVKRFAQRMIDDHTQVNNNIAALAQQKGVALPDAPTPEEQDVAAELATFSGADFDKSYMDRNVLVHVQDVRLARLQSEQGRDPDVKNLAQQTLPQLASHLASAIVIDSRIEASFLYRAYQDQQAKIRLARLALQQSLNQQVNAFAQQVIMDYNAASARTAQLAQQKNVALPLEMSPAQLQAFVQLMGQSGAAFTREYLDIIVQIHRTDVMQATQQSQSAGDADIKAFAQDALVVLTAGLARAIELQQQLNASM